uniref:RING-type domain-containing protein n=1 Tax=Araucaria cunninghamii TaxID=56994 RepID=A0A0D6QR27_ARACU
MGFPSFSGVSAGLLVIINTVLSVQSFKDIVKSFLQILGLFFTTAANNRNNNSQVNSHLRREYSNNPYGGTDAPPVLGSELAQLPLIAEEIRESLPVVAYQPPANTHLGECAICLCKFEEGDQIRELPCSHFFHRICLDKWLDHQQTTCPLCRSSVIPEETVNRLRRREQELTEELMFWFSSFHGHGFHSMWWLRA